MIETQFFFRKDSLQIDAVYRGCKTQSAKWKDPATYIEVVVQDPKYVVSRNYKVVLDAGGHVLRTTQHQNPAQPSPSEPVVAEELQLRSPDGGTWKIRVNDTGMILIERGD